MTELVPSFETNPVHLKKSAALASQLFRYYDQTEKKIKPVTLSRSQQEIFSCILFRENPRTHVETSTQFGKSFTVGLAVLLRAATYPEKWVIVAPTEPKAQITMRVILDHLFDSPIISSQLALGEFNQKLKSERSKRRVTFKRGGEILIISADVKNKVAAGESLVGHGSGNLIIDESSLISNEIYSKIKRMLGGTADNFLLEIGNPFFRNHFLKSFHNPLYRKIIVPWQLAVAEGRIKESFIDEAREEANFGVLYECKFPEEDEVDVDGWSQLITETELLNAFRSNEPNVFGVPYLGLDPSGTGKCFTTWVLRYDNHARVLAKVNSITTPEIVGQTIEFAEKYHIPENHIAVDSSGGAGIAEVLAEKGWHVKSCVAAEPAFEADRYINQRAEMAFRLQKWLKGGGTLERNEDFYQLLDIRYKVRDSSGKIKIISKEELRKKGVASPDCFDSLALTFTDATGFPRIERYSKQRVAVAQKSRTSYE